MTAKINILRIGLAQINPTVGDLEGNRKKIIDYLSWAKDAEVNLAVFPELATCGYPPEDLLHKPHFIKDQLHHFKQIIPETKGITAIIGFVNRGKRGELYNAAALLNNGSLKGIYHKTSLPNYGVFDERRYFEPGSNCLTFSLANVTMGICVCEDIWEEVGPVNIEKWIGGAQIIINISASPYYRGKSALRRNMLRQRARHNRVSICYVNLVGGQDELVFDGRSLILNADGKVLTEGKAFSEDLVVADFKLSSPKQEKGTIPAHIKKELEKLVTPPLQSITLSPTHFRKKRRFQPCRRITRLNPLEEIYQALLLGTRDYVQKNGFRKVVVGLSGGIDSALTATIAVDALGKEQVVGISMPSRFSSQGTKSDTKRLAENLGIRLITIPIESIFQTYLEVLAKEFAGCNPDITEENLQARIRGNLLMALSNKFGWLVLTTGNKSEVAVGYCTLYGDTAGGFSLIKDVPKTMVYRLVRYCNRKEGKPIIPRTIISRAPSAELRANQKDEDTLPPYPVLDKILEQYVESDKSRNEIIAGGFDRETVKKVLHLVDHNEYKRRQAPPGIKITPKSFGKDRRFPITNKYN